MKKAIFYLALASILLLVISSLSAQDPTVWANMRDRFNEKRNNANADLRAKIARQLGEAMYPAVESEAATLLVEHIKSEVGRAKGAIDKEPGIRCQVLDACIDTLKKITQPKPIDYLLKEAQDEKNNWRVRFYIAQALVEKNDPKVITFMIKMIDDKNLPIRCTAFRALTALNIPDALERSYKVLNENVTWELKTAVADYLSRLSGINNKDMVEPLINVMQNNELEGIVRIRIAAILKTLTGFDGGVAGKLWQDWLAKKKSDANPTEEIGHKTEVIPMLYYGITCVAGRVIFIIDISDSMAQAANYTDFSKHEDGDDPNSKIITESESSGAGEHPSGPAAIDKEALKKLKELKAKSDNKPVANRLDAAEKELINTIYYLDPTVEFTMIFFDVNQKLWKETLMPASIENKILALEYIYQKVGVGAGTGLYDALELAYRFINKDNEKPAEAIKTTGSDKPAPAKLKERIIHLIRNCNYLSEFGGADTFFMVTDGAPTYGRIIDKDEILYEIKKINQIRRLKINVVAIGEPPLNPLALSPRMDVDVKFLGKLAEETGGEFRDKTSKVTAGSKGKK